VNGTPGNFMGLTQALALMLSVTFLTYVVVIVVPYLRRKPLPTGDPAAFTWHFLIPCRDEEAVIPDTLAYLRSSFPAVHLWVIDDASEDATAALIQARATVDPMVHLVRRRRPDARVGKGEALNAAYRALDQWLQRLAGGSGERAAQLVCVLDADGRPAPNLLEVCAGPSLFGDPRVGAVQVDVWMVNRDERVPDPRRGRARNLYARTLVRMQDLEFRAAIAAIQLARRASGTVGMGGNGQLARLSALDSVCTQPGRPWGGSLLEDFELGIQLIMAGHRTEFTLDTYVEQEGLWSLRRLLAQRTRWGQGTMQCIRYLPEVWNSRHVTGLGALEVLYYLAQPWLQLFGSLLYPIPFVVLMSRFLHDPAGMWGWSAGGGWILFAVYAAFGTLPFVLWGPIYWRRCERGAGLLRSLGWGLAYSLYIYLFYVTSWRAALRILWGRNGWAKTRRNAEGLGGVVARET
jgi:1,2-diacylglycerol 3-beta-glucosyltransferase